MFSIRTVKNGVETEISAAVTEKDALDTMTGMAQLLGYLDPYKQDLILVKDKNGKVRHQYSFAELQKGKNL